MRKRILLICDFPPGLMSNLVDLYKALDCDVVIVRRLEGGVPLPRNMKELNVPLRVLGDTLSPQFTRRAAVATNTISYVVIAMIVSLVATVKYRCAIIHARFLFPEGVVGLLSSCLSGRPLIMSAEGDDVNVHLGKHSLFRGLLSVFARRARFVSVSPQIQTRLSHLQVSSRLIPNSVNSSFFAFVPAHSKDRTLTFIGRLVESKGPQVLIEALSEIHDFLIENRIVVNIVGDGPMRGALEERLRADGLQDSVRLAGYLTSNEVRNLLSRSLVFVNCSWSEGTSLALLEAMSSGCGVIASDIPGNRTVLQNGRTGLLVPPGDARSLSVAIRQLFEDSKLASELARRAREEVELRYDVKTASASLASLYGVPIKG